MYPIFSRENKNFEILEYDEKIMGTVEIGGSEIERAVIEESENDSDIILSNC